MQNFFTYFAPQENFLKMKIQIHITVIAIPKYMNSPAGPFNI
jgi:hypothetical protein